MSFGPQGLTWCIKPWVKGEYPCGFKGRAIDLVTNQGQDMKKNTLPDIKTQFSEWYLEVIAAAELSDQAPVRGCMVIRPYGYAIWEQIQKNLDERIKAQGYQNAAFPLLIPQSFINKEKEHVEGFAPEIAVVTHAGGDQLEEPLVIRPTSETMIHHMFSKWVHSWRDLPLKLNQWCSVVRWEKRSRPFLRTTEFWWHECHAAHATYEQAKQDIEQAHFGVYKKVLEDILAIPVISGKKTQSEMFAGATATYTHEAIMQDGKALQSATSHLLAPAFAEQFGISFQDETGTQAYPTLSSWGATTRLIGALIMVHGDQKGLILPPRIAPIQVMIVPIAKAETKEAVMQACENIHEQLKNKDIRVHIHNDDQSTPGAKFYYTELRGIPLRIEIGEKEARAQQATLANRVDGSKNVIAMSEITMAVQNKLEEIQQQLFDRALAMQQAYITDEDKLSEFGPRIDGSSGVAKTGWCGSKECEAQTKQYKMTIRCTLESQKHAHCCVCGKPSITDCIMAKSY
ncbi:MAG: Proline-tRNA ligase [candidate division TM6 bacterium GW2011_GWE2_41_16]|nr:MAG: Proline-tRNA ligase [candidate division TM6 bacterium GW2011_GWE2_41_16]